MSRPSLRALALVALSIAGASLAPACTEDSTTSTDSITTTAIAVDPLSFLGDVPCSPQPGAMRTYVATITDVTDPTAPFTLPSSGPLSCSVVALFRYVVLGHTYTAEVDAYDIPGDGLAPFGGASSGSRAMVDSEGVLVPPRWTTSCAQPALATEYQEAAVSGCAALEDRAPQTAAALRVDPSRALGALGCDDVSAFDVSPEDPSLPAVTGLACGAGAVDFDEGIVPGATYGFRVTAQLGAAPLAARCFAVAEAGRTVTATCDALTSKGSLSVAFNDVAPERGPFCGTGADSFEVQAFPLNGGGTYLSGSVPCADEVRFAPLEPGLYGAKVIARGPDGAALWSTLCGASVSPGATAACTH